MDLSITARPHPLSGFKKTLNTAVRDGLIKTKPRVRLNPWYRRHANPGPAHYSTKKFICTADWAAVTGVGLTQKQAEDHFFDNLSRHTARWPGHSTFSYNR